MSAALVSGLAVLFLFQPARAGERLEIVTVLVARKDIASGTRITEPEKFFKSVRYVKGDEPKGHIGDLRKLKNCVVKRSLAEDQPVKNVDVVAAKSEVAVNLPPGHRAFAIKVASTLGVAPGSRVDVVLTTRAGTDKTIAKVLLQDVLVLATDEAKNGTEGVCTVTVAVGVQHARTLTQASQLGTLSVLVRAPSDR
jgi:Flp pilus assembly protein CpaB